MAHSRSLFCPRVTITNWAFEWITLNCVSKAETFFRFSFLFVIQERKSKSKNERKTSRHVICWANIEVSSKFVRKTLRKQIVSSPFGPLDLFCPWMGNFHLMSQTGSLDQMYLRKKCKRNFNWKAFSHKLSLVGVKLLEKRQRKKNQWETMTTTLTGKAERRL